MPAKETISGHDLRARGWRASPALGDALRAAKRALKRGMGREEIFQSLDSVRESPDEWTGDALFGKCARGLVAYRRDEIEHPAPREVPLPCAVWGEEGIDRATRDQMDAACRLPVAAAAALMPDGHVGYGLPIGGVLATRGAVIPHAVGLDIACRMRLSVVDLDTEQLPRLREPLRHALTSETRFGVGAGFEKRKIRHHDVMDDALWGELAMPNRESLRDLAWRQLGTSGAGNHFVEFGDVEIHEGVGDIAPGRHVALLSHSGSRGLGAQIAQHFTRLAMRRCPLPGAMKHLAWLTLDSEEGEAYWLAMTLAGRYAQANHELIHRHVLRGAGLDPILAVENHHNFAWIEEHGGEEVVVHRKGATPAGEGMLGFIPGSMATPGFLVRGRGNRESLCSAAHGAGRALSRRAAKDTISKAAWDEALERAGVELIAGGRDEAPQAYKDIREVMEAQRDLVEVVATFHPRLVLMAGS